MMREGDTVAIFEDPYIGECFEGYARFIQILLGKEIVSCSVYCEVVFKDDDRAVGRWIALDKNGDPLYKP